MAKRQELIDNTFNNLATHLSILSLSRFNRIYRLNLIVDPQCHFFQFTPIY